MTYAEREPGVAKAQELKVSRSFLDLGTPFPSWLRTQLIAPLSATFLGGRGLLTSLRKACVALFLCFQPRNPGLFQKLGKMPSPLSFMRFAEQHYYAENCLLSMFFGNTFCVLM